MEHIRPHQIFAMVSPSERDFIAHLPRVIGGSVFALEACLLVALLRAVRPKSVFEFGTYLGDTTCLLAQNLTTPGGVVYTLDLDSTDGIELEEEDAVLANRSVLAQRSFEGLKAQVEQLLGDSYLFDPTPYEDRIEYVFIDGNHALKYVEKDTANALRMTPGNGASAVIWHDYGNPACPEVADYLDSLSERMPLCHIEETLLVFRLQGIPLPERRPIS
ncbi:MAG TPA: class I SAM-dependent methyltransferase [Solirubrobacteraceae bacterium]|jgi:predicted O-methyltransferase YrrM